MKASSRTFLQALLLLTPLFLVRAEDTAKAPTELFAAALQKIAGIVEPATDAEPQTFTTRLELVKAEGLPKDLAGHFATLAFQAPDRLLVSAEHKGKTYSAGRDQQEVWAFVPSKNFGVIGKPGRTRFATAPGKKDKTMLDPLKLPLPREQVALPFFVDDVLDHGKNSHFRTRNANPVQSRCVNVSDKWIRSFGCVLQVRPLGDHPVHMTQIPLERFVARLIPVDEETY